MRARAIDAVDVGPDAANVTQHLIERVRAGATPRIAESSASS
jgi:hypothetical protein